MIVDRDTYNGRFGLNSSVETTSMDELQHECGIAALYHLDSPESSPIVPSGRPEETSRLMPRVLLDLQNRGQLAAGFTTYDPKREQILDTYKQIGTVIEAFRLNHPAKYENIMRDYAGRGGHRPRALRHLRQDDRNYAQPFERHHGRKWKWFSMAFNGQLANFAELKDRTPHAEDYYLTRDTDTEVIMHYLSYELRGDDRPDLVEVFRNLSQQFDGAYNIVFLNALGDMVVLRDPKGFRPLCYAQDGPLFAAASESVALSNLGFTDIKTLEPGRDDADPGQPGARRALRRAAPPDRPLLLRVDLLRQRRQHAGRPQRLPVARALGKELAIQEHRLDLVPLDDDTVVVPGARHGQGRRRRDGVRAGRAVGRRADAQSLRRPHVHRRGENRADRVRMKYTPLREVLEGKRVLLVEDTIVRSTTLKSLLASSASAAGPRKSTSASPVRRSSRRAFTASTCPRSTSCSRRAS